MGQPDGWASATREWLGRFHPRQLSPLFAASDRPRVRFGLELLRLMLDPAIDLSPREVMLFGLHRRDSSRGSSLNYIGEAAWLRLCRRLNQGSTPVLQDRLLLACLLKGSRLRGPSIQALLDVDAPLLSVPNIDSTVDLVRFLRRRAIYPLVIKSLSGSGGRGDVQVEALEQEASLIQLADGSRWPLREFAASSMRGGGRGAMLQERISAHPLLRPACGASCPTVQIVTTVGPAGVVVLYAVLKLPSADPLDQRTLLLAPVDPSDGRLGGWRRFDGGGSMAVPPPLSVEVVPDWAGCRDAVQRLHRVDPQGLVLGWELALSETGPLVLAAQNAPGIDLYQIARNRGYRDAPGRAMLASLERRASGMGGIQRRRGRSWIPPVWPFKRPGPLTRRRRRAGARRAG